MNENDAEAKEAATWWMKKHPDIWTKWVPDDVAEKVKKPFSCLICGAS